MTKNYLLTFTIQKDKASITYHIIARMCHFNSYMFFVPNVRVAKIDNIVRVLMGTMLTTVAPKLNIEATHDGIYVVSVCILQVLNTS